MSGVNILKDGKQPLKKIDWNHYKKIGLNMFKKRLPMDEEVVFIEKMKIEGFEGVFWCDGRGYCGVMRFAFTYGLAYGMGEYGYDGRYCYPLHSSGDAIFDLCQLSFTPNEEPTGNWIKHKGIIGEYSNPNSESYIEKFDSITNVKFIENI